VSAAGIDAEQLEAFIREQLPDAHEPVLSGLQVLGSGGLSREHYSFDLAWRDGSGEERSLELILVRSGERPGQTDRGKEYRLMRALAGGAVPVPDVHWCDESGDWLTRPFIVMQRVGGAVTPPFQIAYPESPTLRRQLANQFIDALADLHCLDWRALGLEGLGVPGGEPEDYARGALLVLQASLASTGAKGQSPVIPRALAWLGEHTPRSQRLSLCHGDYKPDNVLHEEGRILAIVDWERARIADPMLDLGYVCVPHLRVGELAQGLALEEELVERYAERTNFEVEPTTIGFWKLHLLLQTVLYFHTLGLAARGAQPEAPSPFQGLVDHLLRLIEQELG
jgi:aminoglycoside phosphotransferase (APT) family kinase protein